MRSRCFVGDARRRRFFDDLLMAALHGAVALAQVNHVAVIVGQHLEFDVPRPLQEFLHVDLVVAERGPCLGSACTAIALSSAASLCTTRMPRPPPPPEALMITG